MAFLVDQSGELIGLIQRLNSPGFIQMYGGSTPPGGWAFCDGSELDPALFPQLFAVIGTTYNTGGETPGFFRVPDFRSRSPIGVGQGSGLSLYALGARGGEENHVLTTAELATHTHLQNSHNHTQDAHTHVQDSHNHTQDAHTHTQNSHTHTQDAHTHTVTDPGHTHTLNAPSALTSVGANLSSNAGAAYAITGNTAASNTTGVTNQNTTATNQATTATNQNATATNQATTATNQNTVATNQATTATNQNEGGGSGHNTLHPYLAVNFMIKLDV